MSSIEEAKHRILSRVDLGQLVSETVSLKSVSGRRLGLCPFHEEKSPSFYVFEDHYFCFGCKAHGDAIEFVRKTKGLGFIESLKSLADKFGVDVPELTQRDRTFQQIGRNNTFYKMMSDAQSYFKSRLETAHGKRALAYLVDRGFSEGQIQKIGFGCTPEKPWDLADHLRKLGHSLKDAEAVSLVGFSQKSGKPFDFFRDRLMIPICDSQGRVVAFGGRTMVGDVAKYKNSATTPLFDKSSILFGFHTAREPMRKARRALIVEGYMDALQMQCHGFEETVACMGTSLSLKNMRNLENIVSTVFLLFDGDAAGQRAILETLEVSLSCPRLRVLAVRLPEGEDPDELVLRLGKERFESDILSKSIELIDFVLRERFASLSANAIPDALKKEVLPWINAIPDGLQRSFLLGKVSQWIGIPPGDLAAHYSNQLRQSKLTPLPTITGATQPKKPDVSYQISLGQIETSLVLEPLSALDESLMFLIIYADRSKISDYSEITYFVEHECDWPPEWVNVAKSAISGTHLQELAQIPGIGSWIEASRPHSQAYKKLDLKEGFREIRERYLEKKRQKTLTILKAEALRLARLSKHSDDDNTALSKVLKQIAAMSDSTRSQSN